VRLGRRRLNDVTPLSRAVARRIGIDAEHAQLGAEPRRSPRTSGAYQGCLSYVVVGVEHQLDAADVDGREVGIGVVDRGGEIFAWKPDGAWHVADEQIHGEGRQLPP